MLFHQWEVVQIFQRESVFCSKISSGVLIYQKIGSGGNQFWGVHFYHDTTFSLLLISVLSVSVRQLELRVDYLAE